MKDNFPLYVCIYKLYILERERRGGGGGRAQLVFSARGKRYLLKYYAIYFHFLVSMRFIRFAVSYKFFETRGDRKIESCIYCIGLPVRQNRITSRRQRDFLGWRKPGGPTTTTLLVFYPCAFTRYM